MFLLFRSSLNMSPFSPLPLMPLPLLLLTPYLPPFPFNSPHFLFFSLSSFLSPFITISPTSFNLPLFFTPLLPSPPAPPPPLACYISHLRAWNPFTGGASGGLIISNNSACFVFVFLFYMYIFFCVSFFFLSFFCCFTLYPFFIFVFLFFCLRFVYSFIYWCFPISLEVSSSMRDVLYSFWLDFPIKMNAIKPRMSEKDKSTHPYNKIIIIIITPIKTKIKSWHHIHLSKIYPPYAWQGAYNIHTHTYIFKWGYTRERLHTVSPFVQ